jgi:hypothetical protein
MRALIIGGTGLLGRALLADLPDAVVLTRDPNHANRKLGSVRAFRWEPETGPPPAEALREIDAVFNLAGEPLADGRWTDDKKRRIRNSRILSTRNLIAGLTTMDRRPEVLVSASAIGFYGDRGDDELDEQSAAGRGFLADVCADWEREAMNAAQLGMRVVCVRTGIVLARGGGALARMLTPFKMGAGGQLGSGKQWTPWIHIHDVVGILLHASRCREIEGPINAVSPHPVTNAEFTQTLARALHRPAFLAVPRTALRLLYGEMSDVLFASCQVLPRVAERTGYHFKFTDLGQALADAV